MWQEEGNKRDPQEAQPGLQGWVSWEAETENNTEMLVRVRSTPHELVDIGHRHQERSLLKEHKLCASRGNEKGESSSEVAG